MQTRIQKWGNSLAVRIPKAFAIEAELDEDTVVEVTVHEGQIVIKPVAAPAWTLEELVAGITKANRHAAVETGAPAGREAW